MLRVTASGHCLSTLHSEATFLQALMVAGSCHSAVRGMRRGAAMLCIIRLIAQLQVTAVAVSCELRALSSALPAAEWFNHHQQTPCRHWAGGQTVRQWHCRAGHGKGDSVLFQQATGCRRIIGSCSFTELHEACDHRR